jgi:hypothetical protein
MVDLLPLHGGRIGHSADPDMRHKRHPWHSRRREHA